VTRLREGRPRGPGSITGSGKIDVSSPKRNDQFCGPLAFLLSGYRLLPDGLTGRGVELTTPSIADVKNGWRYSSISPCRAQIR
jgi:hypothetical protein